MSDKTDAAEIIVAGQIAVFVAERFPVFDGETAEKQIEQCVEYFNLALKAIKEKEAQKPSAKMQSTESPFR